MSPRERIQEVIEGSLPMSAVVEEETVATIEAKKPLDRKRVQFGSIQIREYNRIVGDHPDVKVGPPLGLSWEYVLKPTLLVDEYEANRAPYKRFLRMSSISRRNLLMNVFNIPEQDIANAEKEVQRIKKLREKSNNQSAVSAVVESKMKRAGRGLRKHLGRAIPASANFMVPPIMVQA